MKVRLETLMEGCWHDGDKLRANFAVIDGVIADLQDRNDLPRSVGKNVGKFAYVGFETLNRAERKKLISQIKTRNPIDGETVESIIRDYDLMDRYFKTFLESFRNHYEPEQPKQSNTEKDVTEQLALF